MSIHPAQQHLLGYFTYEHLPEKLGAVSRPFCELAHDLVGGYSPDGSDLIYLSGPELTVALRKLLEAKDAAVRAALETES